MNNILVIGGSGFVGAAVVPALQKKGYTVTLLNRGNRKIADTRQLVADRNDAEQMQALSQPFDAVIDTSSYTREQTEIAFKAFGARTQRWIHLSSAAVYSETPNRLPNEKDPVGGAEVWGDYGRNKAEADRFLLAQEKIPAVCIRPPYLYGPNNDLDREQFVWSRALTGRPIILPADGQTKLQFLHEDDLASFILHLLSLHIMPIAAINLADPHIITTMDWVTMLSEIAEVTPEILNASDLKLNTSAREHFPFHAYDCAVDTTYYLENFDWQPTRRLRDGFRQTYNSYTRSQLEAYSPTTPAEKAMGY